MIYEIATYSLKKVYKSDIGVRMERLNKIAGENHKFLAELGTLAGKYGFELDIKTQSESEDVAIDWGLDKAAQLLGKKGGNSTLKKYGKEKMTEWGKKGGRPSAK